MRGPAGDIESVTVDPGGATSAVVLLHGYGASAADMGPPSAQLAAAGHLAVAISLRGFGRSAGEDDCGLGQPDDVGVVVTQLRADEPRLRRVGLLGISQGGQVALLAAARGFAVDAVAAWAPVTDVARWRATTAFPEIRSYIDDRCADGNFADRSPLAQARDLRVPVLLVHGDADTRVPTEQSRLLHDAIRRAGGRAELELLPGVEHRRGPDGNRLAMDLTLAFLATHLGAGRALRQD